MSGRRSWWTGVSLSTMNLRHSRGVSACTFRFRPHHCRARRAEQSSGLAAVVGVVVGWKVLIHLLQQLRTRFAMARRGTRKSERGANSKSP